MITATLRSTVMALAMFLRARFLSRVGERGVTIQHRALLDDRMTSKTL